MLSQYLLWRPSVVAESCKARQQWMATVIGLKLCLLLQCDTRVLANVQRGKCCNGASLRVTHLNPSGLNPPHLTFSTHFSVSRSRITRPCSRSVPHCDAKNLNRRKPWIPSVISSFGVWIEDDTLTKALLPFAIETPTFRCTLDASLHVRRKSGSPTML